MGDLIPLHGDEPELELPHLPIREAAAEILVILRDAIASADAEREELAALGDTESLAIGLVGLRMLVRDLRTLADATEDDLARVMGEQRERMLAIEYVGIFKRQRSTTRREWQSVDLARRLVVEAMERGEINHPLDVVELLLRHGSITWRVTPLRESGLDPAEWCVEDDDHYSIRHIPPGGAAK